jgi:hypothetical protein
MLVIQLWRGGHLDLGPYSEIPKAKTAGGITQVIDHLPSKCKGLSSNLNIAKKFHLKKHMLLYMSHLPSLHEALDLIPSTSKIK